MRRVVSLGYVTLVLVIWAAFAAGSAAADVTVQVNTTSDTPGAGQCSLREALAYANGMPEPACGASAATGVVAIMVPAGCYELSAGELRMPSSTPVVIDGAGPGPAACTGTGTVIDGQHQSTVLADGDEATVTLNGVTITGGFAGGAAGACSSDGCAGGGILDAGATLTLNDVTVTGNVAGSAIQGGLGGDGGGIDDLGGTVTVENSTISANSAGNGASAYGGRLHGRRRRQRRWHL